MGIVRHIQQALYSNKAGNQCEYIATDGACLIDIGVGMTYSSTMEGVFYINSFPSSGDFKLWSRGDEELLLDSSRRARWNLFVSEKKRKDYRTGSASGQYFIYNLYRGETTPVTYGFATSYDNLKTTSSLSSTVYEPTFNSPSVGNISIFGKIGNEAGWAKSGTRIYRLIVDGIEFLPWYLNGEYGLMRQDTGEFFGKSYGDGTLTGLIA